MWWTQTVVMVNYNQTWVSGFCHRPWQNPKQPQCLFVGRWNLSCESLKLWSLSTSTSFWGQLFLVYKGLYQSDTAGVWYPWCHVEPRVPPEVIWGTRLLLLNLLRGDFRLYWDKFFTSSHRWWFNRYKSTEILNSRRDSEDSRMWNKWAELQWFWLRITTPSCDTTGKISS